MKQRYKGILCIISAAFFFALMGYFVRLSGDLPAMQKSFFRNLVAFFIAAFALYRQPEAIGCKKTDLVPLLIRSLAGTIGIVANFYAVDHLLLSDASMLNKMSPFFAVLFSAFILKEKVKPFQLMMVLGAFAGSLLVIKPSFSNMDFFPSVIGFIGGMTAGLAYTMVRKLGENGVKGPFIVCFFSGFSCLTMLPWLIFDFHPMSAMQLLALILAGFSAAGGQFSVTAAYCYAPAREISVFDYSQIIFSALLGFVFFGQIPDALSWLGYLIICSMAVGMFLFNNRQAKVKTV